MKITSIMFFPNGQTAVCDDKGQQAAKYQGKHHESIKALADDGIDWRTIHEIIGSPNLLPHMILPLPKTVNP